MIKRYRKKPVIVEAILWDGDNYNEVFNFTEGHICKVAIPVGNMEVFECLDSIDINTLEGSMRATKGDYIIKGVKGEFYPCKSDIFKQIYEEVN